MNSKTVYLMIGLAALVAGVAVMAFLLNTPRNQNVVTPLTQNLEIAEPIAGNRPAPTAADNPALAEVVDIEKIDVNKILSAEELDIVEFDQFIVPKNVAEIELMSNEEKTRLELDTSLVVQVLGRMPDGSPRGYRFINSAEDLLIDTR